MNTRSQEAALAIFGSAARGDSDIFSDQDLLIVSDNESTLREMKSSYEAVGWSCTTYTWSRLQHAADQGSLFVQHLKQESRVLWDPSSRLAQILDQYSTNGSYKGVSDGASTLVGNLTQHLPLCDVGPMWTMDVLFVAFRSLAVANLADNGIYAFSNSEIIDGLTIVGRIKNEDKQKMSDLRRFKSLYRQGIVDQSVRWSHVYEWIGSVDRIFSLGLSPKCVQTIDIVDLALADDAGEDIEPDCTLDVDELNRHFGR